MSALSLSETELSDAMQAGFALAQDYWRSLPQRGSFHGATAEDTTELFASRVWPDAGIGARVWADFKAIADHSRTPGGAFFGYVLGSNNEVAAIAEFLVAVLHQNVTAWRSGPAAVTVERTVVRWLADAIGCVGFSGSLCGGGSSANIMGLTMAREAKFPANEDGARPCVLYASEQVHMSIDKAVALLGIGRRNLRLIPVDANCRMRTDALAEAIAADRAAGHKPVAIVASAGTVNTGAIDPLPEIAAIAKREDLWLHVDGAYGALASIAAPGLFAGLNQADSLSLDAHKWLYQPLDCGCLLFRDPEAARKAFSASGDYVKVANTDPVEAFAFFDETLELSRRFRALKLWMSLQYFGRAAFARAIAKDMAHAQMLVQLIGAEPELELLAPVALSAVCFRHRSSDNAAILKRVIENGRVYISNAAINGEFALRACFVNDRTREEDVRAIVSEVLAAAQA